MSSPLHRFVYPFLDSLGFFNLWTSRTNTLRVVTYHGVIPNKRGSQFYELDGNFVTPEQLRDQILAFQKDFDFITPAEAHDWALQKTKLPKRALLLTCDDGLANNVSEMLPVLIDTNSKAIFFCTSEFSSDEPKHLWHEELYAVLASAPPDRIHSVLDRTENKSPDDLYARWWELVNQLGKLPKGERQKEIDSLARSAGVNIRTLFDFEWGQMRHRLMTKEEIRKLRDAGMTIGSHTVSHAMLATMAEKDALTELQDSKSILEEVIQDQVWALSYPFGGLSDAGQREWDLATRAGYAFGVMNVPMKGSGLLNWGRVNSGAGSSIPSLKASLSGFHDFLKQILRQAN
jgi:peptidoglycan/xylan/chitin deacetylase (PgdA/CDA1 family)